MSNVVLMRQHRDCLVAVLATVLGVTWEKAAKLLWHKDLRSPLTSLLFSTHWWLKWTLRSIGASYRRVDPEDLMAGRCSPMGTILLVKQSLWAQHWVVWAGLDPHGFHLVYWGDSSIPSRFTPGKLWDLLHNSWPYCCLEVTQPSSCKTVDITRTTSPALGG